MSSKNWDIFNIFNLNGSNIRLEYWKSKTESKQRGGKDQKQDSGEFSLFKDIP